MATVLEPTLACNPTPESWTPASASYLRQCSRPLAVGPSCIGIPRAGGPSVWLWFLRFWRSFGLILQPLNRAWLALGRLLHRVVSPLVMMAIFFLCVTPIAWILRLRGKDVLSLAHRPDLRPIGSYVNRRRLNRNDENQF